MKRLIHSWIRHMRQVAILSLAALCVIPAAAVTDGKPDGNGHPAVVLIVMDVGGTPAWRCTGTLLSPTIVLSRRGRCHRRPHLHRIRCPERHEHLPLRRWSQQRRSRILGSAP
jgi:hypothetical protein